MRDKLCCVLSVWCVVMSVPVLCGAATAFVDNACYCGVILVITLLSLSSCWDDIALNLWWYEILCLYPL